MSLFIVAFIALCFYLIPTIIAFIRNKRNKVAIFALNFFLGWSLVGWVVSLVWALTHD
ncbi:superinfection immunity protein [Pseudobacillus sp. FSL P4-0506]|uniref:superinfection immunity protein n=1 Tax=unclassified Pseudobacillus TaxID=2619284 RepID=UPI0030F8EC30